MENEKTKGGKFFKVLVWIIAVIAIVCIGFTAANKINERQMKNYIDSFDKVYIENQLRPMVDDEGNYYFETDGDFKILHLTDIHLGGGILFRKNDEKAINAVAAMVSAEKPDLVVVTGDIAFAIPTTGTLNNKYAHEFFKRLMENLGVYWTITLGNHDTEDYNFYDRAAVAEMYSSKNLEYCLFSAGPRNVYGECNHVINVKNSKGFVTQSLVMIDTNAYIESDIFGLRWLYDNVRPSQIQWYQTQVETYRAKNLATFQEMTADEQKSVDQEILKVKTLMFMHIPIKEVKYAYDKYVNNGRQIYGELTEFYGNDGEESPVVYCPVDDEELFETMLSNDYCRAMFYGHDHLNNFVMKYCGVTLSYGYSIDYSAYSGIDEKGYQRGCTVITSEPDGSFDIVHENYYQDKYPAKYEKETVDMAP